MGNLCNKDCYFRKKLKNAIENSLFYSYDNRYYERYILFNVIIIAKDLSRSVKEYIPFDCHLSVFKRFSKPQKKGNGIQGGDYFIILKEMEFIEQYEYS